MNDKKTIKGLQLMLTKFYEFLGFLELSEYLKTQEMQFSKYTIDKTEDILRFVFNDFADLMIEFDPNFFINHQGMIPKKK